MPIIFFPKIINNKITGIQVINAAPRRNGVVIYPSLLLSYRYNPAIKYSVELFPNAEHLGQLRVNLRTQNPTLIALISDFYNLYAYLEKTNYNPNAVCMFDGVKFTRLFDYPNEEISAKMLAEKITEYVKHFDKLLNIYFSNQENEDFACALVEKRFKELKDGEIIL